MDFEHFGKLVEWKERKFRFKAMDDGRIVGTISGKFESGVLRISTIIIDESERGKGIGIVLMQKAENFGIKLGAHKVWLETGADWKARQFYESLGYKKEAGLPDHYFHHDFVIYSKMLKP